MIIGEIIPEFCLMSHPLSLRQYCHISIMDTEGIIVNGGTPTATVSARQLQL